MNSNSSKSKKTLSPEAEFSEKLTFRDYLIATEQEANKPLPLWRLFVPLLIQTGLILAVPFQAYYTDMSGRTVILQGAVADREDIRDTNSLLLNYNISRPEILRRFPGWGGLLRQNRGRNRRLTQGTNLYAILQERESYNRGVPRAWRLVRVSGRLPTSLPADEVALKGVYRDGFITYGTQTYYIPQEERSEISNDLFRELDDRYQRRQPIIVKVKVDTQGNVVPISFWVGDRNYRF
jgi:uncharacterized membrane-anchored protein